MRVLIGCLSVLLIIAAGCGDGSDGTNPVDQMTNEPDTVTITAFDTLGAEMGDTPDVFAFIVDAAYTPDGNVAVLDAGKIVLQVFTPSGEELFTVGRKGSGPGEYQLPLGLAVTDYGFVLSDISGGKLLRYDIYGEPMDEITGFFPVPPVRIRGAGSRFIATDFFMDVSDGELPSVSMDFVAYADSSEPVQVFERHPMDTNGGMITSDAAPGFAFASGPGEEAYIVLISDSLFKLTGYTAGGEKILDMNEEMDRIPLSSEEMEEEELSISLTIENGESALATSRNQRTDTHRDIIESVGVDSEGSIWVRMGDTGETYFRVYSPGGELLHIAVPDESMPDDARYSISPEGMLAYDSDPVDWPKVYLLEVNGR